MIGELVAVAIVVVLPATIILGSLALLALSVAGLATADTVEGVLRNAPPLFPCRVRQGAGGRGRWGKARNRGGGVRPRRGTD